MCLYVKKNLTVTPINTAIDKPDGVEDLWFTVQCRKLPDFIIGCFFYRHPHSSVDTFNYSEKIFKFITLRNKAFYVLGDFNCNFLLKNNKMENIIFNAKLTQLFDKPTRTTS